MSGQSSQGNKLGLGEKLAFGAGNMNNLLMNNILNVLLNPIYNIALGVSPALVGYATAIPRLWDAVTDPVVGSLSDNFRSRWGRRKPFMVLGALISALSLIAIWLVPPVWGEYSKFLYLIAVSLVFYTGNTLFLVPYTGLGLALSDDYRERTNLFAYQSGGRCARRIPDSVVLLAGDPPVLRKHTARHPGPEPRAGRLDHPLRGRFRSVSAGSVTTGASPARRRCRS